MLLILITLCPCSPKLIFRILKWLILKEYFLKHHFKIPWEFQRIVSVPFEKFWTKASRSLWYLLFSMFLRFSTAMTSFYVLQFPLNVFSWCSFRVSFLNSSDNKGNMIYWYCYERDDSSLQNLLFLWPSSFNFIPHIISWIHLNFLIQWLHTPIVLYCIILH